MAERDYYTLLGLPRTASPDQIKQRFRELARAHHPDVAGAKSGSHERFIRINEAYQVLGDTRRRAAYDLTLRDRERIQQAMRRGRPSDLYAPRAAAQRTPPEPRTAARAPDAAAADRLRIQLEQVLHAAEAAYSLGKLREAERLCRTVLEQDRRCGLAYELLGDICARQRRTDGAIQMYTMAAQLTPHNGVLMTKLNRVMAREGGVSRTATGQPRVARARSRTRATYQVLVALVGLGAVCSMFFYFATQPAGTLLRWPLVEHWTEKVLLLLVLSGWITGYAFALSGMIGSMDEELLYSARASGRPGMPVGALLGVSGGLFFYAGVAIYLVIASARESASRSVLLVLLSSALLMGGFAGVSWWLQGNLDLAKEILFLGGNVVFLSMLAGWFIGDIFRPLWV